MLCIVLIPPSGCCRDGKSAEEDNQNGQRTGRPFYIAEVWVFVERVLVYVYVYGGQSYSLLAQRGHTTHTVTSSGTVYAEKSQAGIMALKQVNSKEDISDF